MRSHYIASSRCAYCGRTRTADACCEGRGSLPYDPRAPIQGRRARRRAIMPEPVDRKAARTNEKTGTTAATPRAISRALF